MEMAFEHRRIFLMKNLGISLPLRHAVLKRFIRSQRFTMHWQYLPTREISQPGDKFNQVSTHINSVKETRGEIVNDPDDIILVGSK